MPVLIIMDIEGATVEQYDHVDRLLGGMTPENAPPGLISHTAGVTDTGIFVADVWESPEAMQQAFETRLGPALAEAGVPEVQPQVVPVHNHLHGVGRAGGRDRHRRDRRDDDGRLRRTWSPTCRRTSTRAAGIRPSRTSPAPRRPASSWSTCGVPRRSSASFAESQIAPRAGDRMGAMTSRYAPVHRHVPVKAPTSV